MKPVHLAILLQLVAGSAVLGQPPSETAAADPAFDGRQGRTRVVAPRIEAQAEIDGVLDEPEWARAARLTGENQAAAQVRQLRGLARLPHERGRRPAASPRRVGLAFAPAYLDER